MPVWVEGDSGWVNGQLPGEADVVELECDARLDLHHFATRGALRAIADSHGMETWFSFGQLNCADPANGLPVDPVVIEPVLQIRVSSEGVTVAPTSVIARADSRWRFASTLADRTLQEIAPGEIAMRVRGDQSGPRRARVVRVNQDELVLALRGREEVTVRTDAYTLAARVPLVQQYVMQTQGPIASAIVLRNLRIAAGSLDASGRVNSYAVKERERRTSELLDRLGREINYPDGVIGMLGGTPLEIHVES